MKKVLAISGGVDSVVLLHIFRDDPDVVVAHFDHGIRTSSVDDAKFVEALAKKYELPFYLGKAELGPQASEEQARISRYEYFKKLATGLGGEIYTAHHLDDLIESVAINLTRGTGWRGLVPLGNSQIKRPFIDNTLLPKSFNMGWSHTANGIAEIINKKTILQYAAEHNLTFRQDPTNTEDKYLRNRLRERLLFLDDMKKAELLKLYHQTNNLKSSIDEILEEILPKNGVCQRSWFDGLDDDVAIEILRAALMRAGISATRPQMLDFLKAIRKYGPGKMFNLPGDRLVRFSKYDFKL